MINHIRAKVWGIVPAAGSGQRMGSATPKQYLTIDSKTMLEATLDVLLAESNICHVVVCTAKNDTIWNTLPAAVDNKVSSTCGGDSRAQSVLNGLSAIADQVTAADWVLVHDAARPCLRSSVLARMIDQLLSDPVGGILAVPVKDTLKISTNQGQSIERTLDRSQVWHAQTPQMFRYGLLKHALESAIEIEAEITDEASAMEAAGHHVKLVQGDARNIKITTDDDLKLAKLIFRD